MDATLRDDNYKKMQGIMDVHFPWLPVIQPVESYGVQNYVAWRPSPNQQFELRREVLTLNR